jgi:transposase-like protein
MATTSAPLTIAMGCPICPRCGTRMLLARIFPDRPGYNRRTYECPRCEYDLTEIVRLK